MLKKKRKREKARRYFKKGGGVGGGGVFVWLFKGAHGLNEFKPWAKHHILKHSK